MLRIIIAAGSLFLAAYFLLGMNKEKPLEEHHEALDKAKAVEETLRARTDDLQQQLQKNLEQ